MTDTELYFEMVKDTKDLVANCKASQLTNSAIAYNETAQLSNDVEFWRWMGANYPKNLGNEALIQQTAVDNSQWLNTQLQGKGYEWDYMLKQRTDPTKIFSRFDAGTCPNQPGIDITETNIFGDVEATYQNKAYLSSNNPNLHNTPKDAIVVTNQEKVAYAKKLGYKTEQYMDNQEIAVQRDSRFKQAVEGRATTSYSPKVVLSTAAKAGAMAAVIAMTAESIFSYKKWKKGQLSNDEYLKTVLSSGAVAGASAGATTAIMFYVQSTITLAGASSLIGIPVAILINSALSSIIIPIFNDTKYKQYVAEAKYYQSLEYMYKDFIQLVDMSSRHYEVYIKKMLLQQENHKKLKTISKELDNRLADLYDSI